MDVQTQTCAGSLRPLYRSRLVRPVRFGRVAATAVPESRLLARALPIVDSADAFAVTFPGPPPGDPQQWADAIFRAPPVWVRALFGIRQGLVRVVGIESGDRHVFDTVAWQPDEVLVGSWRAGARRLLLPGDGERSRQVDRSRCPSPAGPAGARAVVVVRGRLDRLDGFPQPVEERCRGDG